MVAMSGTGYSAKGFIDMPVSSRIGTLIRAGIEQVNLSGGNYTTSLTYATADGLIRYSFSDEGFTPFVAGGLGIHFPVTKTSTILDVPSISSTTIFFFGGGFTYPIRDDLILMTIAEYAYFPPSGSVATNFMTVRAGAGWRF